MTSSREGFGKRQSDRTFLAGADEEGRAMEESPLVCPPRDLADPETT